MNSDDLAAGMRAGECDHGMRVPPGAYIVVRADGRSFSRLTARLFEELPAKDAYARFLGELLPTEED